MWSSPHISTKVLRFNTNPINSDNSDFQHSPLQAQAIALVLASSP